MSEWHVTWRSIIVPLLAPASTKVLMRSKSSTSTRPDKVIIDSDGRRVRRRRRDEKWQPFGERKTGWEVD